MKQVVLEFDDEEMENFIFGHAKEKIYDLTPNDVRTFLYE